LLIDHGAHRSTTLSDSSLPRAHRRHEISRSVSDFSGIFWRQSTRPFRIIIIAAVLKMAIFNPKGDVAFRICNLSTIDLLDTLIDPVLSRFWQSII
jgi:hypothetical protein